MSEAKATILCVDDDPDILRLLEHILSGAGYRTHGAGDAEQGLRLVEQCQPDLVLLDVRMPGRDGFDVCRTLKSRVATRELPIIFLSAASEAADVETGLQLGAVDYVNKPPKRTELLLRVGLHVQLRRNELDLRQYNSQLEHMVKERTRELIHADRLASIGTLAAGTAHEINNPTSVIRGNIETFRLYWSKLAPLVDEQLSRADDRQLRTVQQEVPRLMAAMSRATDRIKRIVQGLLRYGGRRPVEKSSVDLHEVIAEALELTYNRLKYNIQVHYDENRGALIQGSFCELSQIFVNLLTNAADAIGQQGGEITISMERKDGWLLTHVDDNGSGIPADIENRVTEPFFTNKGTNGTGLGLPICIGIAHDHGGTFQIANRPEGGCRATLTLPLDGAPHADVRTEQEPVTAGAS